MRVLCKRRSKVAHYYALGDQTLRMFPSSMSLISLSPNHRHWGGKNGIDDEGVIVCKAQESERRDVFLPKGACVSTTGNTVTKYCPSNREKKEGQTLCRPLCIIPFPMYRLGQGQ